MFLRPSIPVALALSLFAVPAGAQAPPPAAPAAAHDTAKGASLIAEARKVLGGEDKIAAIKRIEVKGSGVQVTGNQTLDSDLVMQIETPDKLRIEREISLPGGSITVTQIQGLNANEAWDTTDGNLPGGFGRGGGRGGQGGRFGGVLGGLQTDPNAQGRGQLDPAREAQVRDLQRKQRQTELARYLVAFLLATPEAPAWIGTAVTPKDEKADVLEFTTADGTATRLFLDVNTHLPLMMTYSGPAARAAAGQGRQGNRGGGDGQGAARGDGQGGGGFGRRGGGDPAAGGAAPQGQRAGGPGQPTTVEFYLGDYKAEGGIKFPYHITREIAGEIQEEINIKSIKLNPNFKSNTFTQPK
jgi:hypothetical protein